MRAGRATDSFFCDVMEGLILTVSHKGLILPPEMKLTAKEYHVRVAITDSSLFIQLGEKLWRRRSPVSLPFYSYRTMVALADGRFSIDIPPDVLEILSSLGTVIEFDVYCT